MSCVYYFHTKPPEASLKRKSPGSSSGGNNTANKKPLTNERREERNAREKERSLKITQQIHELRSLLTAGGVIVPKVSIYGVFGYKYFPSYLYINKSTQLCILIFVQRRGLRALS